MALSRPFKEDRLALPLSHASLLQVIDGVASLPLCPQVVSQAPQHFRSSETPPLMIVALPTSLSAQSFLFTPACPVQYVQKNFRRWMPTIDTCQSGLPIPFFTFCSKLIESQEDNGMCFLTVTSWGNPAWVTASTSIVKL